MSSRRTSRPGLQRSDATDSAAPGRASDAVAGSGGRAGTAFLVAVVALAIAAAGLVFAGVALLRGDGDPCRTTAWAAVPATAELPAGWNTSATQVMVGGLSVALAGPTSEATGETPAVYLTVTCYGDDAAAAIDLSRDAARQAATATGEEVTGGPGVGDDGYAIEDPSTGSTVVHFRRGPLVAYVSTSGAVAATDLQAITVALDGAIARSLGDPAVAARPTASGTPAAVVTPDPAASGSPSPGTSPEASPSPSQAAPELVAMLPDEVDGTALVRDSATGSMVLGEDTMSRALAASIRDLGATVDDLQVAQAYDETDTLDVYLLAFRLPGVPAGDLAPAILESWLAAGAAGVTVTDGTIGGKAVTTVIYGDEGNPSYVYRTGEAVIVLDTGDPALAAKVVALLP